MECLARERRGVPLQVRSKFAAQKASVVASWQKAHLNLEHMLQGKRELLAPSSPSPNGALVSGTIVASEILKLNALHHSTTTPNALSSVGPSSLKELSSVSKQSCQPLLQGQPSLKTCLPPLASPDSRADLKLTSRKARPKVPSLLAQEHAINTPAILARSDGTESKGTESKGTLGTRKRPREEPGCGATAGTLFEKCLEAYPLFLMSSKKSNIPSQLLPLGHTPRTSAANNLLSGASGDIGSASILAANHERSWLDRPLRMASEPTASSLGFGCAPILPTSHSVDLLGKRNAVMGTTIMRLETLGDTTSSEGDGLLPLAQQLQILQEREEMVKGKLEWLQIWQQNQANQKAEDHKAGVSMDAEPLQCGQSVEAVAMGSLMGVRKKNSSATLQTTRRTHVALGAAGFSKPLTMRKRPTAPDETKRAVGRTNASNTGPMAQVAAVASRQDATPGNFKRAGSTSAREFEHLSNTVAADVGVYSQLPSSAMYEEIAQTIPEQSTSQWLNQRLSPADVSIQPKVHTADVHKEWSDLPTTSSPKVTTSGSLEGAVARLVPSLSGHRPPSPLSTFQNAEHFLRLASAWRRQDGDCSSALACGHDEVNLELKL